MRRCRVLVLNYEVLFIKVFTHTTSARTICTFYFSARLFFEGTNVQISHSLLRCNLYISPSPWCRAGRQIPADPEAGQIERIHISGWFVVILMSRAAGGCIAAQQHLKIGSRIPQFRCTPLHQTSLGVPNMVPGFLLPQVKHRACGCAGLNVELGHLLAWDNGVWSAGDLLEICWKMGLLGRKGLCQHTRDSPVKFCNLSHSLGLKHAALDTTQN